GLIFEGEPQARAGRGRPSELLHLRPASANFLGFKLTGDALYAAVTDLHAEVSESEEHPLVNRDVSSVVRLIGEVANRLHARYPRLAAIGVCSAGDVQDVGGRLLLVDSPFLGWDTVPLAELVSEATGLPTVISNDVQALTAAHHWFGAGVGCRTIALIGFGAGIGSGIVVNDELVTGSRGHPGKVGHIPVTEGGPTCDAGHVGCVSAYVTIPSIVRNAHAASYPSALKLARAGEPTALAAMQAAGKALGVAIVQLANFIDPEKIIVTGEGLPLVGLANETILTTISNLLDPAADDVTVDFHEFRFSDYAWAAAISAIRLVV
ncbi:MAG TPA: ROK family protein, partial [Lacisediminihabitans sp.]|uniref:ROK family protein n=1 Tax=Lacisediminihabitans sp. TaxID=2787631 RepID=UPI002ED8D6A3